MKPRVKLSLRFSTEAHADAALVDAEAALTDRAIFDRPQPMQRFFDVEFGTWVVYGDVRCALSAERDTIRAAWVHAMETALLSPRVLPSSYVSSHLSYHDEGYGGAADRATLVVRVKA